MKIGNSGIEIDALILCEYVNNAWGFTHRGWFIERTGAIRSFKHVKGGYLTRDNGMASVEKLASLDELARRAAMRESTRSHAACDAGVVTLVAYPKDIDAAVTLVQCGDYSGVNPSPETKSILRELREIEPDDSPLVGFCAQFLDEWGDLTV